MRLFYKPIFLSLLALIFSLSLVGCTSPTFSSSTSTPQASGCDIEESCISLKTDDPSEITAKLVADFQPISFQEAIDFFKTKKSGLLYFGFVNCPWCQEVVPILHDLASQEKVTVYYIEIRDRENTRLYSDEEREEIIPYLGEFMKENSEGIPTLYVPLVVALKDGQVVLGHRGTVSGHNAHEEAMSQEQKNALEEELKKIVETAQETEKKQD